MLSQGISRQKAKEIAIEHDPLNQEFDDRIRFQALNFKCPKCGSKTKVVSVTHDYDGTTVRYRRCRNDQCHHKFITEQVTYLPPQFHEKIVPKANPHEPRVYRDKTHLFPDEVRQIREMAANGVSRAQIQKEMLLSRNSVANVIKRRTYKHIE